jgi:hypothetical protein
VRFRERPDLIVFDDIPDDVSGSSPDAVLVRFNAYPIETAPKDREIMLLCNGYWWLCEWKATPYFPDGGWFPYGRPEDEEPLPTRADLLTHWAEIEDMKPTFRVQSEG